MKVNFGIYNAAGKIALLPGLHHCTVFDHLQYAIMEGGAWEI